MVRESVLEAMRSVFKEVPFGIDHTMRVLANAQEIMQGEGIGDIKNTDIANNKNGDTNEVVADTIAYAAILHDIGAVRALEKYGSLVGHYQELEGPAIAREILQQACVDRAVIERVEYIVGYHHTPEKIDGLDFQILWDADILDNFEHDKKERDRESLNQEIEQSFRTQSGKELVRKRLGLNE